MRKKSKFETIDWVWAYALVNGRLADIYFEKGKGTKAIFGHGYLDKIKSRWSKEDKALMKKDIQKNRFTYRKGKYYPAKSTT